MPKTRVMLADDHAILRKGLHALLDRVNDIEVLAEAQTGLEAIEQANSNNLDVIVMDIGMPELNGIEATHRIKKSHPNIQIIILTVHSNEEYISQIFQAGASGYIMKDSAPDELIEAIRSVSRGNKYLSPKLSTLVVDEYIRPKQRVHDPLDDLTDREREILQLIGEGNSNKGIAEKLFISVKTVETHRTNLANKLNIHKTAELIQYAIKRGLVILE